MHVKVKRAGPRSPKPATGPCLVRHSCALRGCSNLPSVHNHRLASSHTDPYFCSCLPGLCPVSRKPECPNPHNLHRSDPRWPELWEHASVTRKCSIKLMHAQQAEERGVLFAMVRYLEEQAVVCQRGGFLSSATIHPYITPERGRYFHTMCAVFPMLVSTCCSGH